VTYERAPLSFAQSASAATASTKVLPTTPAPPNVSNRVTRKSQPLNECSTCRLDFASLSAFDAHRVGKYPQTGPSEYRDRLATGLVPVDEDWRPEHGRRCLSEDELRERGFRTDKRGRWRRPPSGRRPWIQGEDSHRSRAT
jgi:hypothetical protein